MNYIQLETIVTHLFHHSHELSPSIPSLEDEVFSYDPAVPILDEDFHAGGSMQKEVRFMLIDVVYISFT